MLLIHMTLGEAFHLFCFCHFTETRVYVYLYLYYVCIYCTECRACHSGVTPLEVHWCRSSLAALVLFTGLFLPLAIFSPSPKSFFGQPSALVWFWLLSQWWPAHLSTCQPPSDPIVLACFPEIIQGHLTIHFNVTGKTEPPELSPQAYFNPTWFCHHWLHCPKKLTSGLCPSLSNV